MNALIIGVVIAISSISSVGLALANRKNRRNPPESADDGFFEEALNGKVIEGTPDRKIRKHLSLGT